MIYRRDIRTAKYPSSILYGLSYYLPELVMVGKLKGDRVDSWQKVSGPMFKSIASPFCVYSWFAILHLYRCWLYFQGALDNVPVLSNPGLNILLGALKGAKRDQFHQPIFISIERKFKMYWWNLTTFFILLSYVYAHFCADLNFVATGGRVKFLSAM